MRITLSERKFTERIRELEGIGPEVTSDEIAHRLDHYAKKLFQHLRAYGINQVGLVSMSGTLGEFYVGLDKCHDDDSRNLRIQGLSLLDPLSVTLEQYDLGAFFVGGLLTTMYDAFEEYQSEVTRLTVSELDAALPRIAERLVFAPRPTPFTALDENDASVIAEYEGEQFDQWCLRSGLKVPDRKVREIEEYNNREVAAEAGRREAAYEQFRNGNG